MNYYNSSDSVSNYKNIKCEIKQDIPINIDINTVYYSEGQGINYNIGEGLKYDKETNTLSVDTATTVEKDNTKPVTSAAVYTEIGNINALLSTI